MSKNRVAWLLAVVALLGAAFSFGGFVPLGAAVIVLAAAVIVGSLT